MRASVSRINPHYNTERAPSCYDYGNYSIELGCIEKYYIVQKMGRGKYSEVFEGKSEDGEKVVIKVLKPVKQSKINREVLILKSLEHKNIVALKDVVLDVDSETYSLIFDYIRHQDTCQLFEKLNIGNIRFYTRQMLEALQYAHSRGIIHRDIKPQNMIVDTHTKQLKIIDWGLAEFYLPEQEYSVRVASKYYKSPELLVGYPYYDYSLDIWSFGCILAELLLKKRPFFYGAKSGNQIIEIVKILGKDDLREYLKKYEISDVIMAQLHSQRGDRVDFLTFVDPGEYHLVEDGVDLLEKIFVYDHNDRPSAAECLAHRFFKA